MEFELNIFEPFWSRTYTLLLSLYALQLKYWPSSCIAWTVPKYIRFILSSPSEISIGELSRYIKTMLVVSPLRELETKLTCSGSSKK